MRRIALFALLCGGSALAQSISMPDGGVVLTGKAVELNGPTTVKGSVTPSGTGKSLGTYSTPFFEAFAENLYSKNVAVLKYVRIEPAQFINCTVEGLVARDENTGGTSGAPTKICICLSDGLGAFSWRNLVSGEQGTYSTCP